MISRVLIVGFGSIGHRHLRVIRERLPRAQIAILRRAIDVPRPVEADVCFHTMDEALAYGPQLSVVANPAPLHVPTALALVRAGSHLLIEKPLSDVSEAVGELIGEAEHRQLRVQTAYNMRFLPSLRFFRKRILEEVVGQIMSVRCEVGQYLPEWRPGRDYRETVSAKRTLGGGVLLELSHEIDYLRWIFGDFAWVQATLLRQGDLDIDVEDTAHLLFGFSILSGGRPPVATVTLDFVRRDVARSCTVIGSKGSLRWNGVANEVLRYVPEQRQWASEFAEAIEADASYRAQLEAMLDGIDGGDVSGATAWDGLAVVRAIEAARTSSAEHGRRIDLANEELGPTA